VCALDRAARICGLKPASSSDQMESVPSVEEAAALADLIETKLDALDRLSRECDALDARLQTGTFAHLRVEHDTADILLTLLQDSNTDASLAEAFAEYFGGIVESTRLKLAQVSLLFIDSIYTYSYITVFYMQKYNVPCILDVQWMY
jgi:hypothetical protein